MLCGGVRPYGERPHYSTDVLSLLLRGAWTECEARSQQRADVLLGPQACGLSPCPHAATPDREEKTLTAKARLVLADGAVFEGELFGAQPSSCGGVEVGEVVFTTGMTGYQEVITDPSYCGQIVVMTAPHIGNTGTNAEDDEATRPFLRGLIVHELSAAASNWRNRSNLDTYLRERGIVALTGIDTRRLTLHLREHGVQAGALGTAPPDELVDRARAAPSMQGSDLVCEVSTKEAYAWRQSTPTIAGRRHTERGAGQSGGLDQSSGSATQATAAVRSQPTLRVAAIDLGLKRGILRSLVDFGCEPTVLPSTTDARSIRQLDPQGVFLSNGPGDPAAIPYVVDTVRELLGSVPIFGICLGHQVLCQALGASTYKLKFGHHGINHPVQDLATKRVEITSQNHGFAVDIKSIEGSCRLSHLNLNDGTCEGMASPEARAFSVQYHPEASAGPNDARYLFQRFRNLMLDLA